MSMIHPNQHAARIGELTAELSMAIRKAAKDGITVEATVTKVGFHTPGKPVIRIPRINIKVI